MGIMLHEAHRKAVVQKWERKSILAGKTSDAYKWDGNKAIIVSSILTQPLNDFKRSGDNRYGTPKDVEDWNQRMEIRQDKSFSAVIDKGNNTQQDHMKNAGTFMNAELEREVVPYFDKLCLKVYATSAGKIDTVTSALTSSNIIKAIRKGVAHFVNKHVSYKSGVYLYIPTTIYSELVLAPEYTSLEKLGTQALTNGEVGKVQKFTVVEVADDDLPVGTQFLLAHKDAVVNPKQLWDTEIKTGQVGYRGPVIEGSFISDGFVIGELSDGVYCCTLASTKCSNPTIAKTGAITVPEGTVVKYTTDDSDPRYSLTAKVYTSAITQKGVKVKAFAYVADDLGYYSKFPSDVVEEMTATA